MNRKSAQVFAVYNSIFFLLFSHVTQRASYFRTRNEGLLRKVSIGCKTFQKGKFRKAKKIKICEKAETLKG